MINITLRDRWDDLSGNGERYVELSLGNNEACCVKECENGLRYVIQCYNGYDIYADDGGADFPVRTLTETEENIVMNFVNEQFLI